MEDLKTLLNTIVVEKITSMPINKHIFQHTRWIAQNGVVPIITFDTKKYINPHCHVHEGYAVDYFKSTTK